MSDGTTSMHELLERLAQLENASDDDKSCIREVIEGKDSIALAAEMTEEEQPAAPSQLSTAQPAPSQPAQAPIEEQLYTRISKMRLPEKIKLALLGNATCRTLLIRDANRMIQGFVLKNPRLQVKELEEFARNPNLSEYVIRNIADNNTWTKSYLLKLNLVLNPKTPLEISLKFMRYLNINDVRRIAKSKNVPQTLNVAAKKKVEETKP